MLYFKGRLIEELNTIQSTILEFERLNKDLSLTTNTIRGISLNVDNPLLHTMVQDFKDTSNRLNYLREIVVSSSDNVYALSKLINSNNQNPNTALHDEKFLYFDWEGHCFCDTRNKSVRISRSDYGPKPS